MPNALAIALSPTAAVTVAGASASVDIGAVRSLVRLSAAVTAVTGTTPSLALTVETSADDTAWEALDAFPAISAAGTYSLMADGCKQYVRLAWAVSGTSPSFTFTATGEAHTLYATSADLDAHGLSSETALPEQDRLAALLAASSIADDYLSSAYTMPLASWGTSVSVHVARMAAFSLSSVHRHLRDESLEYDNDRAIKHFVAIARGGIRPETIVDATPAAEEDAAYVVSAATRGW